MSETLVTIHSIIRWFLLVAALVALYAVITAKRQGGWTPLAQRSAAVYAGLLDLQALLGVWIWIAQERWSGAEPFLSWIHPAAMIVAIALAHAMLARARRAEDPMEKRKLALTGVGGSVLLLVLAIPWFAK